MEETANNKTIKVALRDLENGALVGGLRFYADRSRNYHKRIALAKTIRQFDRRSKEHFEDYQDLMRTYGTKGQGGRMSVIPASLEPAAAAEWKKKIEEWRSTEIEVEYDGLPKIVIELSESDMNEFPVDSMEMLLDYAEFKTMDSKDDTDIGRLRKQVQDLTTQLKAMQGPPAEQE